MRPGDFPDDDLIVCAVESGREDVLRAWLMAVPTRPHPRPAPTTPKPGINHPPSQSQA
ncbi:hypothetical protein DVS28_b0148 (plasmid) [Euzebya pacifica]|uniref:Uncharacterized protein n=1 Tax=Euzebya pacifica TaxID=1608957 RepID=A0A346Y621_9ACTN|nr:hypothetical protein DVS28_b0148 [Euzebya pacifica]